MRRTRSAFVLISLMLSAPIVAALPGVKVPEPSGNEIEEAQAAAIAAVASLEEDVNGTILLANATANRALANASAPPLASPIPAPATPSIADALARPVAFPTLPPFAEEVIEEEMQSAIEFAAALVSGDAPDAWLYAEKRLARLEMRLAALTRG